MNAIASSTLLINNKQELGLFEKLPAPSLLFLK